MAKPVTDEYDIKERLAWIAVQCGEGHIATRLLKDSPLEIEDLRDIIIPLRRSDIMTEYKTSMYSRSIFPERPSFWENFDKIVPALQKGHEPLTKEFFSAGQRDRRLIDYAMVSGAWRNIFKADHWVNNEKELISLYCMLDRRQQQRINITLLRKEICNKEGRPYRPELLEMIFGRHDHSLEKVLQQGKVEMYEEVLLNNGLEPDPDDLMIPLNLNTGTSNLDRPAYFDHFPKWAMLFKKYGKDIPVEDMIRQYGDEVSMIEETTIVDMIEIFHPPIWVGRLKDMQKLWAHVDSGIKANKTSFNFWEAYTQAEDASYRFPFKVDNRLKKEALLTDLHQKGLPENMKATGLAKFWENFDVIQDILLEKGTPLTIEDLYCELGGSRENAICKAAKFGYLYAALSTVDPKKGQYLDAAALLKPGQAGKSALDYILEYRQLDEVFNERLWQGNPEGMKELWDAVPDGLEKKAVRDFGMRLARVNRDNLYKGSHHAKPGKKAPRKRQPRQKLG